MPRKKKLEVKFAPGAFDNFEGTQEELDELISEITTLFSEITPEELKRRSKPVTDETFVELEDSEKEALLRALERDPIAERNSKLN